MRETTTRAATRSARGPKRVTEERVHTKALSYLERYASSRENLRQVLLRWARTSCAQHGTDPAEAERMIDAEITRLERVQLLDDTAYAHGRVRSLTRAGASRRKIFMKLKEKGVCEDLIEATLDGLAEETRGDPERDAAIKLARKRRLGPYRGDPEARADKRERDLAALARAGFSFDLALEIVDAAAPDALEDPEAAAR